MNGKCKIERVRNQSGDLNGLFEILELLANQV